MPAEGHSGTKQPMKKSGYTRSTLTTKELEEALDSGLIEQIIIRNDTSKVYFSSGAMPFGQATPNRTGIVANLGLDFLDKAILLGGDVKILQEMSGEEQKDNSIIYQQFTEFTGGLSLDVAKFGNWWAYPFILSGSFKQTMIGNYEHVTDRTNDISFVNGGGYWKFWKRAALMGGYQFVSGVINSGSPTGITTNQTQWAAGFEYTIAEGGVLNATVGQVIVDCFAENGAVNKAVAKNNSKSLRLDLNFTVKF
jgi:hypothetical protein